MTYLSNRTMGVEEELLLVDPERGTAEPAGPRLVHPDGAEGDDAGSDAGDGPGRDTPGGTLEQELQREQVEIDSAPHHRAEDLLADLRERRAALAAEAARVGVTAVPLATFPLPVSPTVTHKARYEQMVELYGPTGHEQLVCGTHVHVAVADQEEGVAVIDRIRPWLSVLLALSANSPYWQGADTTYESYRSCVWARWPTAGPPPLFGSARRYREVVDALVATGAVVDDGMVYWDARLGRGYPTVEVRVADVCLDVRDAALVATLCRALVETAVARWRAGEPAAEVSREVLRLAAWRAGRSGTTGQLVHPVRLVPVGAWSAVAALVEHVGPALAAAGDAAAVQDRLAAIRRDGTGSVAQRGAYAERGELTDVLRLGAARLTS